MKKGLILRASEVLIWMLLLLGVLIEAAAIPQISASLENQYREYSGDGLLIQLMLTSIVIAGQAVLLVIVTLLRRIRSSKLFIGATLKWVWGLVISLLLLASTFAVLLGWLMSKNTLPPSLFIALFVAILVSLTGALVTMALKGVLRTAIDSKLELDGVI